MCPDWLYRVSTPAEAKRAVEEMAARHPDLVKIWVDNFRGTLPEEMPPAVYRAVIQEPHKLGLRVAAHVFYLDDVKQLVRDGVDVLAHGVRDRRVDAEFISLIKTRGVWYIPTLDLDEASYIYAEQPAWMGDTFFQKALSPALRDQFADAEWRNKTLANQKNLLASKAAVATNKHKLRALFNAGVSRGIWNRFRRDAVADSRFC